jgi:RNA polymerase sigma-70 factor (ECF subfamily)
MAVRDIAPGVQTFESRIAAARTGSSWACTTLWVEYAPAVNAFLTSRGSREPEELTSEVFLAAFDRIGEFVGGEAEFRSFVFTIAYRRLIDELRKRYRRGETVELTADRDPRLAPSAEDVALRRLGDDSALRLFDTLPAAQRDVMVLRIVGDLTVEQIAVTLKKRPGAVKALQRRALDALRKNFSPDRTLLRRSSDSE